MAASTTGTGTSRANEAAEQYPGERLGLPASGAGSLASWRARIAALLLDWLPCLVLTEALFQAGVVPIALRGWLTLGLFVLESAILTAIVGGSFGQIITKLAVVRADREPLAWWQALARSVLKALVIPVIVIGPDRRHLDDQVCGTVVVNRR